MNTQSTREMSHGEERHVQTLALNSVVKAQGRVMDLAARGHVSQEQLERIDNLLKQAHRELQHLD